jgi:hypothetical protein
VRVHARTAREAACAPRGREDDVEEPAPFFQHAVRDRVRVRVRVGVQVGAELGGRRVRVLVVIVIVAAAVTWIGPGRAAAGDVPQG